MSANPMSSDQGHRPLFHIDADHGWLNDPNGICRWDGMYHVFFQHNPDRPRHERITWGMSARPIC